MPRLRTIWWRLHRWLALGLGWLLVLSGLTGALLVVSAPVDRLAHRAMFRANAAGVPPVAADQVPLEQVVRSLRAEFGAGASLTLRPPRQAGESLWVLVRGPWRGTLYVDPHTGRELGRRGEAQGWHNGLFKLHSTLWAQDAGKAVLAWSALAYLALLVTGLVLWWPRQWIKAWRVEWQKGGLRALFDLHRLGGAAAGLLIAVSVASGAYMAWRPLGDGLTALAGAKPLKPPRLPTLAGPPPARPPLDQLVDSARQRFPSALVGYVQLPDAADKPVRIRLKLADDPHPNGLSSVWLDPRTGAVLAVHRWNQLDPGARAMAVIYPLHTGALGGVAHEIVVALCGLALAGLGLSGLWLWWWRRRTRPAVRHPA